MCKIKTVPLLRIVDIIEVLFTILLDPCEFLSQTGSVRWRGEETPSISSRPMGLNLEETADCRYNEKRLSN
jgi:hypothetical protein